MDLTEFCARLDERLALDDYADVDASANGLQVGHQGDQIDHVAFAVDAAQATVEATANVNADVLVVHHGIFWDGFDRLTGLTYERVASLLRSNIALYAAHLPLDGHPELGNATRLASSLDLDDDGPFGTLGSVHVGRRAHATDPYTVDGLRSALHDQIRGDHDIQVLNFGPDAIERIGIVTGSGTDWIGEACEASLDALVTGEGKQSAYHRAREAGLHVFLAGHYATETFGVQALQEVVAAWDLETTYVSHPTGL